MAQIEIVKGDITRLDVDAIVNAANSSLMGGGGVDGAIHKAGGPKIMEECREIIREIGSCKTGEAVITTGGDLPAKYVIHTVGPVWQDGSVGEAQKLASCYKNALKMAEEKELKSIAFPNISTGVYGYPKAQAASVALQAIGEVQLNSVTKIIIVCFDDDNYRLYQELIS